jgi:hypothetical protein
MKIIPLLVLQLLVTQYHKYKFSNEKIIMGIREYSLENNRLIRMIIIPLITIV